MANGWLETHFQTEPLTGLSRALRLSWYILAALSTFAHLGLFLNHYADNSFPACNNGYCGGLISMVGILVIIYPFLFGSWLNVTLPHFRFKETYLKMLVKATFEFGGFLGCVFISKSLNNHNKIACWMYVAFMAYTMALFKTITPEFNLSLPSLFAGIAISESLLKETQGGVGLAISVSIACFILYVLQGLHFLGHVVPVEPGWTTRYHFFQHREQTNIIKFRRMCWWVVLILALVPWFIGNSFHNPHKTTIMWVCFFSGLIIALALLILIGYNRMNELRLATVSLVILGQIVIEFGSVFGSAEISRHIGKHTVSLSWMYISLSMYTLAFFKIISPRLSFSLPTLLAGIAIKESLHDINRSTWLPWVIGSICFLIFILQGFYDVEWEWLTTYITQLAEDGPPNNQQDADIDLQEMQAGQDA